MGKETMEMETVVSENGRFIRWNDKATSKTQEEKTVYVGDSIKGILVDKLSGIGANLSNVYKIKTEEHGLLSVWGNVVLDDRMAEVPLNHIVIITKTGTAISKSTNKPYSIFEVQKSKNPVAQEMETVATKEEIKAEDIPL